jgi:UDP-glucose 4-epimerase
MSANKLVLVTGGGGFIGSHCIIELFKEGYEVLVADNWSNSSPECLRRVETISGKAIDRVTLDVNDKSALNDLFKKHKFFAVLHLAALKAVGESSRQPLDYYRNNVSGSLTVLDCMKENNVKNFIFSSSATVYGKPAYLPLDEKHSTIGDEITNPYGKTKYVVEHILKDLYASDKSWNIMILRYFNPVGAHESGLIGEDPVGAPNNLMPYVSQVAVGRLPELKIFGNDYETPDGTGVRDYIHISDLARGHICALNKLREEPGLKIYNLGTGIGYSVLQMITALEKVSGKKVNSKVVERRPGDLGSCYANPALALEELGWSATKNLDDMCKDLWNWQSKNPTGFSKN